jgi:prepilin-type N-terminal cleavage/methylation domain-containing protein
MKRLGFTLGELLIALVLLTLVWAAGSFLYNYFGNHNTSIQEQEQNHPFAP